MKHPADKMVIVGCDFATLETRMMAHLLHSAVAQGIEVVVVDSGSKLQGLEADLFLLDELTPDENGVIHEAKLSQGRTSVENFSQLKLYAEEDMSSAFLKHERVKPDGSKEAPLPKPTEQEPKRCWICRRTFKTGEGLGVHQKIKHGYPVDG